jgi:hypothetical protein
MHKRRPLPRISTLAGLAVCLIAALWPAAGHADDTLESAVKATYLYKLAAFVAWPPGALPADSLVLCVVGNDPFGTVLDQAVAGQTIQQRPIVVRRYGTITANPGCQLMYVAGSDAQPVANVLAAVRGEPVLTVTDGQSDANTAGTINFVLQDGYVRFEIDPRMATQSGLNISSKLLSLAVRLRDQTSP